MYIHINFILFQSRELVEKKITEVSDMLEQQVYYNYNECCICVFVIVVLCMYVNKYMLLYIVLYMHV